MVKPILIANWKNHPGSLFEAKSLVNQLSKNRRFFEKLSFFIAPPAPYFDLVGAHSKGFAKLASQDIFSSPKTGLPAGPLRHSSSEASKAGSYTGEITLDILKSFGIRLSIIGHSERRALGETSAEVSEKVKTSLRSGILPLICIGEEFRDQDGEYFEFLREQLKSSLSGLNRKADIAKLMIAYEPIWAIGKEASRAIEPVDLSQSVIFIRKVLTDLFGRSAAERVPVLYGGSVEPSNSGALLRETSIRGFLVGRASLNAKSLTAIAQSLLVR